jgi:hypothetical protein
MITQSINAAQPTALGIQLTDDWYPGQIRALSVAHNLYMDTRDREEYQALTRDSGGFRMSLLSAMLRLADILDASRRRSQLYLERTRELDLESRMHWWGHYYVAEVEISPSEHSIILWFDFPPNRREQYKEIIPPLQVPYLEEEFERHSAVLARQNLLWHFKADEISPEQSSSREMDGDLERYILEKLAVKHQQQTERDKLLLLDQLKIARPTIERQLTELRASENALTPDKKLLGFADLARHLFRLGGKRDAWTTLSGEYNQLAKSVGSSAKFDVAIELAEMMLEDGAGESAARLLHPLLDEARLLSPQIKLRFLQLLATAYLERCNYVEATATLTEASELAADGDLREGLLAQLEETHLLQGEIFSNVDSEESGGQ